MRAAGGGHFGVPKNPFCILVLVCGLRHESTQPAVATSNFAPAGNFLAGVGRTHHFPARRTDYACPIKPARSVACARCNPRERCDFWRARVFALALRRDCGSLLAAAWLSAYSLWHSLLRAGSPLWRRSLSRRGHLPWARRICLGLDCSCDAG